MMVHLVWMDDEVNEEPPVTVVRMVWLEPLVKPHLEPLEPTETPVEMANPVCLDELD